MFGVITLWVGAWVIWDLVARTGDRSALRRVDHVSQTTGQIGFVFLIVGIVAGFVTAIAGGFDLTAPWLLIAYALNEPPMVTFKVFAFVTAIGPIVFAVVRRFRLSQDPGAAGARMLAMGIGIVNKNH